MSAEYDAASEVASAIKEMQYDVELRDLAKIFSEIRDRTPTLRDYLAAQAMNSMCAIIKIADVWKDGKVVGACASHETVKAAVRAAYVVADAMLVEREVKS